MACIFTFLEKLGYIISSADEKGKNRETGVYRDFFIPHLFGLNRLSGG